MPLSFKYTLATGLLFFTAGYSIYSYIYSNKNTLQSSSPTPESIPASPIVPPNIPSPGVPNKEPKEKKKVDVLVPKATKPEKTNKKDEGVKPVEKPKKDEALNPYKPKEPETKLEKPTIVPDKKKEETVPKETKAIEEPQEPKSKDISPPVTPVDQEKETKQDNPTDKKEQETQTKPQEENTTPENKEPKEDPNKDKLEPEKVDDWQKKDEDKPNIEEEHREDKEPEAENKDLIKSLKIDDLAKARGDKAPKLGKNFVGQEFKETAIGKEFFDYWIFADADDPEWDETYARLQEHWKKQYWLGAYGGFGWLYEYTPKEKLVEGCHYSYWMSSTDIWFRAATWYRRWLYWDTLWNWCTKKEYWNKEKPENWYYKTY